MPSSNYTYSQFMDELYSFINSYGKVKLLSLLLPKNKNVPGKSIRLRARLEVILNRPIITFMILSDFMENQTGCASSQSRLKSFKVII